MPRSTLQTDAFRKNTRPGIWRDVEPEDRTGVLTEGFGLEGVAGHETGSIP